ncbi:HlyD family efflux transporter periplasmic adaptor subunit [soil metagenome]
MMEKMAAPILALALVLGGCNKQGDPTFVQGYVEGEYVHVASPIAGRLVTLDVERGAEVEAGAPLFALDTMPETAARDAAAQTVQQAIATAEDLRQPLRTSEIDSIQAQLQEAKVSLDYSTAEYKRRTTLQNSGAIAVREQDAAHVAMKQDEQRVKEFEAKLETARLGSRTGQIAAAEQAVLARKSDVTVAEWRLSQKVQSAPAAGIVTDVVYRQGEWVDAGAPVVVLLPSENIKVRAFVSERVIGRLHIGDAARLSVDGDGAEVDGTITYIAPSAQYTPPVIYSQTTRQKFVYMVELHFTKETAAKLHPGQPVDVRFSPRP